MPNKREILKKYEHKSNATLKLVLFNKMNNHILQTHKFSTRNNDV